MRHLEGLLTRAASLLKESSHAVALTGAGISTPSGIPDFRSPGSGLWEFVDPLEVASIYAFRQRPERFYHWFGPMAELIEQASPNQAHLALAQLENQGHLQCVITQNVDMLHAKAGSKRVYELHGHLRQATCLKCYDVTDAEPLLSTFIANGEVPLCSNCGGVLKPNVILVGELLPASIMNEARGWAKKTDLMLIAGSSLEMAPAGDLPLLARRAGARLIIVNLSETHMDHLADVVIHADVAEVLPQLAALVV